MKDCKNRRAWYVVAIAALAAIPLAMASDISVARWCYSHPLPDTYLKCLEFAAYFASNGFGVVVVLVGLILLRRSNWKHVAELATAALGAGILADVAKLCVYRSRPNSVDLAVATFGSTFHGFLPLLSVGVRGQSFPSGHAAVAAGLATSLSLVYPKSRCLAIPLGIGAVLSRVLLHVHFPSDVTIGATIGICWGLSCHNGWPMRAFLASWRKTAGGAPKSEAPAGCPERISLTARL